MGISAKKELNRAIFFDRDGVINDLVYRGENFTAGGKPSPWGAPLRRSEFKIKIGVREILEDFGKLSFLRILVTNQPDVSYGGLSAEEHESIMATVKALPFEDVFVCPHGRDEGCSCKKPKPGLLWMAVEKWQINTQGSFLIGDQWSDMEAGKQIGCKTIFLHNSGEVPQNADVSVGTLREAVQIIHTLLRSHEDIY